MYKAFLSHSSKQKPFVQPIFEALGRNNCVYDSMTFEAGKQTIDEIINGLEESGLFVLFLSESAVESTWVQDEIERARNLLTRNMKRILPFIIDKNLVHSDTRIPNWIRDKYNIKSLYDENPQVILSKIRNALYEIALEANPISRRKHELFIGRNLLMDSFEKQMALRGLAKPSCLIMGGIEGVGRRTFLKYALRKRRLIKPAYEPIVLFLDDKESIENIILRLSGLNGHIDPVALSITTKDLNSKVTYLQNQVASLIRSGELLIIVDAGAIVQANRKLSHWFEQFLRCSTFHNTLSICVVSRFKPYSAVELEMDNVVSFEVKPLIEHEVRSLLIEYSELMGITLHDEDIEYFMPFLNGMPEQVQYLCHLIDGSSLPEAKKNYQKIIDRGKNSVEYIINSFENDKQAINLLALLAKLEFISRDYLYKIIGETKKNDEILNSFYAIGVYELVGLNREYIRISHPIADYVRKSKFKKITSTHWNKVKEDLRVFLSEPTNTTHLDAAQLLLSIREALLNKDPLPKEYYIPAFTLRTVVELYNRGKNKEVISLAYTSLEYKPVSDIDIVRELRYWLCMALAREEDDRFNDEIRHFDGNSRHFLMGFNHRMRRNFPSAEYEYKLVTGANAASARARRELVTVYIEQDKYEEATQLAKDNYDSKPSDAYYIQSYFTVLIRKNFRSSNDILVINKLLKEIRSNYAAKAPSIATIMDAEFLYYVMGDEARAVSMLKEAIDSGDDNKRFTQKALLRMHRKSKQFDEVEKLQAELSKDKSSEDWF
jgi:hypothetical protein